MCVQSAVLSSDYLDDTVGLFAVVKVQIAIKHISFVIAVNVII